MTRITKVHTLSAVVALVITPLGGFAQAGSEVQNQSATRVRREVQHTIRDQNGDGLCDGCGQAVGSGQQSASGKKAMKGKHWGPGDGTGYHGNGQKDGTGYGAVSGKRNISLDTSGASHGSARSQNRRSTPATGGRGGRR